MTGRKTPADGSRNRILVDILVLSVLVLLAVLLEVWLGPIQWLTAWIQVHPSWETQDLFFVLTIVSIGLTIFAVRRWRDARHELVRRQRMEEALAESERKQQALLEHIPDITWTVNEELKTVYVSPNVEEIFGYTPEEVCRTSPGLWRKGIPDEDAERVRQAWAATFTRNEPCDIEYRVRHKDGRPLWVNARSTAVYEVDGVRYADGITTDISVRKQAELALTESEENFRALAENAHDGIAIVDFQGNHLFANQRMADIVGYPIAELLKTNAGSVLHPDYCDGLITRLRQRIMGEVGPQQFETINVRKDGSHILTEVAATRTIWHGQPVELVMVRDITERKRTEKALRESEARIRTIFEAAEDAIFVKDCDFRYTDVNRSWLERMGLTREEVVGKRADDIFSPEAAEMVRRVDERVLAGETVKEDRTFLHQGRTFEVNVIQVPIRDDAGRVVALFGVSRDITERKRAEMALRESEENFRALAENADDGIVILDGEGRHLFANRRVAEACGYTVEEYLAKTMRDVVPPEIFEKVADNVRRRVAGELGPEQYEAMNVRKDGTTFPTEVTAARTIWQGKPADLVILRDITERKRAEQALREAEQNFRLLADNANDGIIIVNEHGDHLYVNRLFAEMSGYGVEELLHMNFRQLTPPEEHTRLADRLARVLRGEVLPRQIETAIICRDGRRTDVEATSARTFWKGTPVDLVMLRDVTERKQAEEALQRSEARYRAVVEDQQELICRWDAELEMTFVNEAMCRYFGKTREELIGKTFMPLIPQEDHQRVEAYFASLGPKNPVTTIEHRVITPSGEIRWQEWTNRLLFDAEGNVVEGQAVGRDITERKWAEEGLRQSEKRVRGIFETATTVSFIKVDLDGLDSTIVEFSKGAENIFGYTREEVIGEPLGILYIPESFAGFPDAVETMRKTGKPFTRRLILVRKNGERFHALATSYPIYDVNGELTGTLGVTIELGEES